MKILCLFSIANDYDQPNNNLEAWWTEKPPFEVFVSHFNIVVPPEMSLIDLLQKFGDELNALKDIYNGTGGRFGLTSYRLQWVEEGQRVEKFED